jgi:hypothetical protein
VTWLAIALGYAGFTALYLAMERHPVALLGKQTATAPRRAQRRWLGWALLLVSFALCVQARGWGIGPVLWLGTLTASAVTLVLGLLPYRPGAILPLAWAAPVVATAAWLALG